MKTKCTRDKLLNVLWAIFIFTLPLGSVYAQNGAGSITSVSGSLSIFTGSLWTDNAETLVIRSNANLVIDGTYRFSGKNILIEPGAKITGTGTLIIADPAANTSYPSMGGGTTTVDGNNNPEYITVKISHMNPAGITLGDLTNAESTYTNPSGPLAAALNIGGNLSFDVNGANVFLNANNLQFNTNGIISNPSVNRMVVTGNSTDGHMVKDQTGGAFLYPVGIAALDYTPATINGTGLYNVSVVDYSESQTPAPIAYPVFGMDRTWHIYGNTATTMMLQHNASTNGSSYVDASAWITQHQGAGDWSLGTAEQTSPEVHTSSGTQASTIPSTATDAKTYYTKTSSSALPVRLARFQVMKEADAIAVLQWTTATEQNFKGFDVERSSDSKTWRKIESIKTEVLNGNSHDVSNYRYVDSKPSEGINYYRLKMVDLDESYAYSRIERVHFDSAISIHSFPNPVVSTLKINGLRGENRVTVKTVMNQVIIQESVYRDGVDVSQLSAGIYLLTITNQQGIVKTLKILKQ